MTELNLESVKDTHGTEVQPNDKVALLVKVYGYRTMTDAYLTEAIYLGKRKNTLVFAVKHSDGGEGEYSPKKPQFVKLCN